jgi:hypothetical protein
MYCWFARALEMKRQRARCIRGLYRRHNSWCSRTVTKKVVDELVTRKGCGVVAMTLKYVCQSWSVHHTLKVCDTHT